MAIYENLTEFAGRAIHDYEPGKALGDPAKTAYRLRTEYDGDPWPQIFQQFLSEPGAANTQALVVGAWGDMMTPGPEVAVAAALLDAGSALRSLRHLFIGDATCEECEISWIKQCDMGPLLEAYPALETLGVRGAEGLSFAPARHAALKTLVVQSGGLPATLIKQIIAAQMPMLEHLELWLGTSNYGFDASIDDLAPLLRGENFPRLKYLGLKDSEIADELAQALASAPVLTRLAVLDLSMGTLSDAGATALLGSPGIRGLRKLDVHYHYMSAQIAEQLQKMGIEVDVGDPQGGEDGGAEDDRYVAVSE